MLALLVQLQHSKTNNSSNNNNVSNINSKNHQQYIKNQEKKKTIDNIKIATVQFQHGPSYILNLRT